MKTNIKQNILKSTIMVIALLLTSACSEQTSQSTASIGPVAFESGDECHLCGMIITGFPGPKGELFEGRDANVRKFCSTRDLMSWYLQPENKPNSKSLFVHDMSRSDWNSPDDDHLIPAETAWYVVGSKMKGAMGPTLASFAEKDAASTFIGQHGGQIIAFNDINMDTLNMSSPAHMESMSMDHMDH